VSDRKRLGDSMEGPTARFVISHEEAMTIMIQIYSQF
jgi:hypothetical protein